MRKIVIVSLLLACVHINIALAKVWLLPDYQRKQIYSHRINGEDKERPNNGGGCPRGYYNPRAYWCGCS